MGIGFVVLFWIVLLGGAASLAALMLRSIVRRMHAHRAEGRRAERTAYMLPFACVAFWVVSFLAYAAINDKVFHRDPGLGDSWYAPMPNGDVLAAIDIPEIGYVETSGHVQLVSNVTRMQVEKGWIAGSYDSAAWGFGAAEANASKGFFLLDTSTNARQDFPTFDELVATLRREGLGPHLRPFYDVFREYRHTWFDDAAAIWVAGVPLCALAALALYLLRVRRSFHSF